MCSSALAIACVLSAAAPPQAILRDRLPHELRSLDDEELARIARMSPLPALTSDPTNRVADVADAASLGRRLFFDARLSPKGVSCATCHDPDRYFTDGKPLAEGLGVGRRNTPTIVDAARRRWNGWDGKFDSSWSQALAPIEHPLEMGGSRARLLRVIRDDEALRSDYERVFGPFPLALTARGDDPLADGAAPDQATQSLIDAATANALKAFGAFERTVLSPVAPIDRFVAGLKGEPGGDLSALEPTARRGLATFVSKGGCYQCHRGPSFTDEEFHALGLAGANGRVPDDPARLDAVDFVLKNPLNAAGRFSDAADSPKAAMVRGLRRAPELFGQFRTPPLRGVARTAPYMHDGRFPTLDAVLHFYDTLEGASPIGHHGETVLVPLDLGPTGRADLRAFLESLTPIEPVSRESVNPSAPTVRTDRASQGR